MWIWLIISLHMTSVICRNLAITQKSWLHYYPGHTLCSEITWFRIFKRHFNLWSNIRLFPVLLWILSGFSSVIRRWMVLSGIEVCATKKGTFRPGCFSIKSNNKFTPPITPPFTPPFTAPLTLSSGSLEWTITLNPCPNSQTPAEQVRAHWNLLLIPLPKELLNSVCWSSFNGFVMWKNNVENQWTGAVEPLFQI